MDNKKFYWLKLKRDFFKRHDIRIIEEMENGKDYILFYLKMLLESIDHEGELRFSETIPYNEKMLSVITNTNIDIVRSAMKVFLDLKMIEIFDDSTIYMTEVLKLTGSETASAERKRKSRRMQKLLSECDNVTNESDIIQKSHTEIELELEKELDKDIDIIKSDKPTKPKRHKYGEYNNVLLSDDELEKLKSEYPDWEERIERLSEYIAQKGNKYKSHYVTIKAWARKDKEHTPQATQKKGTMDRSYEWYELAKEMDETERGERE